MYKVLIVADSPHELNMLSQIISWEENGFEVVGLLPDSRQALRFLKGNAVDILIVDVRLPYMDGVELAQGIRANNLNTRCVFLIYQEDFFFIPKAVSLDIESFLLKPLTPQLLLNNLLRTIQKPDQSHNPKKSSDNRLAHAGLPAVLSRNYLTVPINHIFERSLISQKYTHCFAYLDNLFSDTSFAGKPTLGALKNHAIELVVYIINVLRSCNIDVSDVSADGSDLFCKILQFQDMQELYVWMKEFLTASVNALETQNKRFSPCISRVVAQIEKNFAQDISLKAIAYDLNINAAYLGQRFKLETGQHYSAYVNRIRIEYAKKLLAETSHSLSEVSELCGYVNVSYFYNMFKKLTGQTPSQYRIAKTK